MSYDFDCRWDILGRVCGIGALWEGRINCPRHDVHERPVDQKQNFHASSSRRECHAKNGSTSWTIATLHLFTNAFKQLFFLLLLGKRALAPSVASTFYIISAYRVSPLIEPPVVLKVDRARFLGEKVLRRVCHGWSNLVNQFRPGKPPCGFEISTRDKFIPNDMAAHNWYFKTTQWNFFQAKNFFLW
jgi:hypothetical protein